MNKDNDLDFAEIDLEREKRTGFPEVIYGETKTPDQSAKIAKKYMINLIYFSLQEPIRRLIIK